LRRSTRNNKTLLSVTGHIHPSTEFRGENMPPISRFKCDKCDFEFPTGWGGFMYVENDKGERIPCTHPIEGYTIAQVLGRNAPPELVRSRTGFNSFCICLDCQYKFAADLNDDKANPWRSGFPTREKNERECPQCRSKNVKSVYELLGKTCPVCRKGKIVEIPTGLIS
jgi:hypothetical protein